MPSASTPITLDRFTTSCPSQGITTWHRAIVDNSMSMGRHCGDPFSGPATAGSP